MRRRGCCEETASKWLPGTLVEPGQAALSWPCSFAGVIATGNLSIALLLLKRAVLVAAVLGWLGGGLFLLTLKEGLPGMAISPWTFWRMKHVDGPFIR
ncbi:MAG: hypothetical protein IRZ24_04870 [Thermogemmatispora sp.]|uniref:hypothetical protein n=1 Tax=Thermogemmatispora sp. TaxID=1968838 RepID=UPI001D312661|nr:hypothetical protein [Thermogemmatispora sp.]MBX5449380.1 hypothetical protein [Thermogemmatispora sp.]